MREEPHVPTQDVTRGRADPVSARRSHDPGPVPPMTPLVRRHDTRGSSTLTGPNWSCPNPDHTGLKPNSQVPVGTEGLTPGTSHVLRRGHLPGLGRSRTPFWPGRGRGGDSGEGTGPSPGRVLPDARPDSLTSGPAPRRSGGQRRQSPGTGGWGTEPVSSVTRVLSSKSTDKKNGSKGMS